MLEEELLSVVVAQKMILHILPQNALNKCPWDK